MAKLFVDPESVGESTVVITDKNDIHHITRVLRMGEGDTVCVSDKTAWEYECVIETVGESSVTARIVDKQKFAREPEIRVTVYQGIPKAGKMENIIQKCVELGAYEIVPFWTDRTVIVDKGNFGKKLERWQRISDEAVKQCKRGIIPEISTPVKIKDIVNNIVKYELTILAYENEDGTTLKDCLKAFDGKPKSAAVIIGPEGGFSDEEARILTEAGAVSVSLGRTILRTETAAPAALAMIMYEYEL